MLHLIPFKLKRYFFNSTKTSQMNISKKKYIQDNVALSHRLFLKPMNMLKNMGSISFIIYANATGLNGHKHVLKHFPHLSIISR